MANTPVEAGLGKCLAPGPAVAQRLRGLERDLVARELAIGLDAIRRDRRIAPARHFLVEGAREGIEVALFERQARGHGMSAEAADELGVTRRDAIEHVADVNARHRARRAAQRAIAVARERDDRTAHAILDATRDQSHDALVPVRHRTGTRRDASGHRSGSRRTAHGRQRRALHARFDLAALDIERIETRGERQRFGIRVGQQATNADRHVIESARRH